MVTLLQLDRATGKGKMVRYVEKTVVLYIIMILYDEYRYSSSMISTGSDTVSYRVYIYLILRTVLYRTTPQT